MSLIKDKKIAIAGGGPGGLTLARLLQIQGIEVKVYERDAHKDARPKGATLDLHEESGLMALKHAGLMDEFWANYRPGADKLRVLDEKGNIILDEHGSGDNENSTVHGRPEIDRGPLKELLLNSLKPGTVSWDSRFVGLSQFNDGWLLKFENGKEAIADLVIAADGAGSKLRSYITEIKPFYCGYTAIEGMVMDAENNSPVVNKLMQGGKIFALGNSQSLIVSSKGDGSLVFYPCFKTDENWVKNSGIDFKNKRQVTDWFKNEFEGWNNSWLELFENTDGPFIPRPLYCMPLDQTWEAQSNLTILGDAAHLMPPYAGEGVNMAMLDALELSQCLLDPDIATTHFAIAVYENQMRKRAAEIAGMSLDATEALHSPGAMQYLLDVLSGKQ